MGYFEESANLSQQRMTSKSRCIPKLFLLVIILMYKIEKSHFYLQLKFFVSWLVGILERSHSESKLSVNFLFTSAFDARVGPWFD